MRDKNTDSPKGKKSDLKPKSATKGRGKIKSAGAKNAAADSARAKSKIAAAAGDLFGEVKGAKAVKSFWVSGVQFAAVIPGFDDARLRNLSPEWVPKPVDGNFDFVPTAAGVIAWLEGRVKNKDGLPESYSSMTDFCAQTGFAEEMLKYALRKGCKCRDSHGRISLTPFLEFFAPLFTKIFSGGGKQIAGLENFDDLDLNVERAGLTRAQKLEQERLNALAEQRIHDVNDCEQRVRIELLGPFKEGWQAIYKKWKRFGGQHPELAREILDVDVPVFLRSLSDGHCVTANMVAERGPMDYATDFQI